MKGVDQMTVEELAAFICETLSKSGIRVTLSGGGCAAIWSRGRYVSSDLDFITEEAVTSKQVSAALQKIGFAKSNPRYRHYHHTDHDFHVEFPSPPLMVGNQRVRETAERVTSTGVLRLLTPTDCVKDRLAAHLHWHDQQALHQAAYVVAEADEIDLDEVRRWVAAEGGKERWPEIVKMFNK